MLKMKRLQLKIKLMKSIILLFFIALIFITCNKKNDAGCSPVKPDTEFAQMTTFCDANGITYTVDSNGIYYQVIDQGSGVTPNMNSVITVTYTASTLDGNVVDNTTSPVSKPLSDFIEGWRLAIPYIQKGGHIKMVLPSSLAYGCTGISNLIAPNSPLYYDVILVDVQ
jgi:FKBP-type peptidyl-prolyl cis-trans isomerase FkpA